MELLALSCGLLLLSLPITLYLFRLVSFGLKTATHRLPPGSIGLPLIGETLEFITSMRSGKSEKFFSERMGRHSPDVFTTSILGDPRIAVLCGSQGSRFLFCNANKLVAKWQFSRAVRLVFAEEGMMACDDLRNALHAFIVQPDNGLRYFVGVMDAMAQRHFRSHWHQQVTVYPLVEMYTFAVASRLFMSTEDPDVVKKLMRPMETIMSGLISLPINLPGTRMNRALKAAAALKLEILQIVRHQRMLMEASGDHSNSELNNLLSYFLQASDDDVGVAGSILGMLIAGHDTTTSILTMIFKVMADYPHVYHRVYQENMEVASKKTPKDELLNWEDTQELRYTWNVAREVMRLHSPTPLLSREALSDFTYAGYHIPKGFKLMTSVHAIHKDPRYFPEPETFDPSRFERDGPLPYTYMPFGGGPNLCPGRNYAQLVILVFIHNAVKRFKWETLIPHEKILVNPMAKPAQGLPLALHAHAHP